MVGISKINMIAQNMLRTIVTPDSTAHDITRSEPFRPRGFKSRHALLRTEAPV